LERREIEKGLLRKEAQKQEKKLQLKREKEQTRKRKRESTLISSPITTASSTAPPSPPDSFARYPLRKRTRFSSNAQRSPSVAASPVSTRTRRESAPETFVEDNPTSTRKRRLRHRIPDDDDDDSSQVNKDVPELALSAIAPKVLAVLTPDSALTEVIDVPPVVRPPNRIIPDSQSLDDSTITTITGSQQQNPEHRDLQSTQSNNDLSSIDSPWRFITDSAGHSQDQDAQPVPTSISGKDVIEELKDAARRTSLLPIPTLVPTRQEDEVDQESISDLEEGEERSISGNGRVENLKDTAGSPVLPSKSALPLPLKSTLTPKSTLQSKSILPSGSTLPAKPILPTKPASPSKLTSPSKPPTLPSKPQFESPHNSNHREPIPISKPSPIPKQTSVPKPTLSAPPNQEDDVEEELNHVNEREVHRRSRSKSNELFHSNRPPSPPLPRLAIPSSSPSRSTLLDTQRQSPQRVTLPIAPIDSQETVSQVTPQKSTPIPTTQAVVTTVPEVLKSSESSEPLFFTAVEVSHTSASLREVSKATVIDTQETVSQATPEKSVLRPVPGPIAASLSSNDTAQHILPSVENSAAAPYEYPTSPDLIKHHIAISIEKSATPVPEFSTMDPSSSIPAPPSQLPETFVTQPLPPRPGTPSSVGSHGTRDVTPALTGTDTKKRKSGFMQRRAQEKELLEKQWAEKAQAVREASVQMRFGSLAPASQVILGNVVQVSQGVSGSPGLALHSSEALQTRLESPARVTFLKPAFSAPVIQSPGMTQAIQHSPSLSQPSRTETVTRPLAESVTAAANSNDIQSTVDTILDVIPARPADLVQVTLPDHVQKLYVSIYDKQGEVIEDFLDEQSSSRDTLDTIQKVINQANDICFHPDAQETGSLSQTNLDDAAQKEWDMQQSPKLAVLEGLFQAARNSEKHIALFAKSGRSMDILERFVGTCGISFRRPAEHRQMNFNTPLRVTLLSPDANSITDCADVVIGLDETFDAVAEQVSHVRRQLDDRMCPAWQFVVPNSIDHVARTFPAGLVGESRTRAIIGRATQFRRQTGANDTSLDPVRIGQQLAAVLSGSAKDVSDVFHLPSIGSMPPSRQDTPVSKKRAIEDVASSSIPLAAKRTRFEESAATHVSDTTATQPTVTPSTGTAAAQKIAEETPVVKQPAPDQQSNRSEDAATTSLVSQLRLELLASTSAMTKQDVTIDKLITENEAQSREVALLRQQIEAADAAKEKVNTKWTDTQALLTAYKAKEKELREDLFSSHKALRDSAVPELVDYISLRVAANQVEPLQRKLASMEKTSEYVREQHRVASDAAATAAAEVQALQAENERLQAAASGNTLQLRTMFEQQSLRRAHEEVEMLRQQAAQKDQLIRRLEEQNRTLREKEDRRGMGANTRASSMPPTAAQAAQMIAVGFQGMGKALPAMMGSGTASALARTAVGMVGGGTTRSPVGSRSTSRAGSRQGSPAKDRGRR